MSLMLENVYLDDRKLDHGIVLLLLDLENELSCDVLMTWLASYDEYNIVAKKIGHTHTIYFLK